MPFVFKQINKNAPGAPLVLLHGWGGNINSLQKLAEEIGEYAINPIYNLELAGFGDSQMPKPVMSTHDFAEYLNEFLTNNKIKEPILIGHSFGGKTIIDAVSSKLIKPKAVVLICTSGIKPQNNLKKSASKLLKKLVPQSIQNNKKLKTVFYKYIIKETDYLNSESLKESLSLIVEEHYDDKLEKIKIPVLIIWAENDSYVPVWMGRKIHSLIKDSKLIIVPNSTHGLPLHKPKIVSEIIYNWILTLK